MINMTDPTNVAMFWMMIAAILLLPGSGAQLFLAWTLRKLTTTQRMRYVFIWFAVLLSAVPLASLARIYGLHDSLQTMSDFRHTAPVFGWVGTVALAVLAAMPLLALVCAVHVYRKPVRFAYTRSGGYVVTSQVRNPPIYDVLQNRMKDTRK